MKNILSKINPFCVTIILLIILLGISCLFHGNSNSNSYSQACEATRQYEIQAIPSFYVEDSCEAISDNFLSLCNRTELRIPGISERGIPKGSGEYIRLSQCLYNIGLNETFCGRYQKEDVTLGYPNVSAIIPSTYMCDGSVYANPIYFLDIPTEVLDYCISEATK